MNAAANLRQAPVSPQVPRELLALLQLGQRIRAAESCEALAFIAVNESRQLFEYRQAALWIDARVVAVSGVPALDHNEPYMQWLSGLCRALSQAGSAARTVTSADVAPRLAESWADWLPAIVLWQPLTHGERVYGALLFAAEAMPEYTVALAAEIAPVYAHALAAFAPRAPLRERVRRALAPTRNRVIVAAVVTCVALLPIRQTVPAAAEVAPLEPFLVRAPLDGVIDKLYVQPNQAVAAGTPLFVMDVTALQTRSDVARKAYDTALERYRQAAQAAVTDNTRKLDVAIRRGELEEREAELAFAANQLSRVQVKAERDGVAVFTDVNDWQGKAVLLGERILTLADPSKVVLIVDLPASQHLDIARGAGVTLYPNSDPLTSYRALVTHIAYQAEPARDGVLAYRVKAEFVGDAPRIGSMGTAKIAGARAPLIYHALRRPLTAARQWLGW